MALDGTTVRALVYEFNKELLGAHISKIAQTEKDELLITFKDFGKTSRLLISVNPSLPVIYLTDENKAAPLQAPSFCMLLRKHLQGGQVVSIIQPSLERIIDFEIEHYNEMGDLCRKILTVELMGKHSNIIFRDGTKILDSIRHVSGLVSSVREVLPGREYFIPFSADKINPLAAIATDDKATPILAITSEDKINPLAAIATDDKATPIITTKEDKTKLAEPIDSCGSAIPESKNSDIVRTIQTVCSGSDPIYKSLYMNIIGFSPSLSEEIVFNAGIDGGRPANSLNDEEKSALNEALKNAINILINNKFTPCTYKKDGIPEQFCPWHYNIFKDYECEDFADMSEVLINFYQARQTYVGIRQKTSDLRQIVNTLLAKDYKKYDLQIKQIKDTGKKDKYKVYGELLTAYGYSIENGSTNYKTTDFYTGEEVTIPLDPTLTAIENGKKYFEKYSKLKRTYESLSKITLETQAEIEHLESISVSLDTALNEADIADIRREMSEAGFIKSKDLSSSRRNARIGGNSGRAGNSRSAAKSGSTEKGAGKAIKSAPLHFVSSDGFDIYVGKNNFQNEYITFKLANGDDWWFHAKKRPGSHVIVKSGGSEVPDKTFEEAAALAAHFSKSDNSSKIEIDYAQRKHIKKPAGGRPGFVIYHTNFSMTASGDISEIKQI